MRRLPPGGLAAAHAAAADGYASDDDACRPRAPPRREYGVLQGDNPAPKRLSGEAALAYQVRQNSGQTRSSKVRFLDAVLARPAGQKPSLAQTAPRITYQRHCALLGMLPVAGPPRPTEGIASSSSSKLPPPPKNDLHYLRDAHRFLRSETDDDGSWEARLAQRYYQRLYREYVICDLVGYRKGNVGFRWRTEGEVVQGRGQFYCGHRPCSSKLGLRSYEVDFKYQEAGERKRALVKVRLCEKCAYKLHYRRLRAEAKRKRRRPVSISGSDEEGEDIKRAKKEAKGEKEDEESKCEDTEKGDGNSPDKGNADEAGLSEEERRRLESLAWRGPDPTARDRADDIDDFLNGLFM